MLKTYKRVEDSFEKLTHWLGVIVGNSLTFILALAVVVFWLTHSFFWLQNLHDKIGDLILGVTFLSLFTIQKSFNRFSGALHFKINELVASHEPADNAVIDAGSKTEREVAKLTEEYQKLYAMADAKKLAAKMAGSKNQKNDN